MRIANRKLVDKLNFDLKLIRAVRVANACLGLLSVKVQWSNKMVSYDWVLQSEKKVAQLNKLRYFT